MDYVKRRILHGEIFPLYVGDELVLRATVELGRLVTDPRKPRANFYDAPAIVLEKTAPLIVVQEDYDSELVDRAGDPETAVLERLFLGTSSKLTRIGARRSQRYVLMNQTSLVSEICSFESARTFLKKNISRGNKIYMITGFRTLIDFRIETRTTDPRALTSRPTEGAIFPVETSISQSSSNTFIHKAHGEFVYSIQYARISFKRFSNSLEPIKLLWDSHPALMLPRSFPTADPTTESDADKVDAQNSHAEAENVKKREEVCLSRNIHVLSFLWMT